MYDSVYPASRFKFQHSRPSSIFHLFPFLLVLGAGSSSLNDCQENKGKEGREVGVVGSVRRVDSVANNI